MQNRNKTEPRSIDYGFQPYHRRWNGSTIPHSFKNSVGGATLSPTKREMQEIMEARNRKNKALKAQKAAQTVAKR
jgi:hypothetical protein